MADIRTFNDFAGIVPQSCDKFFNLYILIKYCILKMNKCTYVNATYNNNNNFLLILYFYLMFQVTTSDIKKKHVCDSVTHKCIFWFLFHVCQF